MPDPVLRAEHISKSYPAADGTAIAVLREISFEARPGETVAITGPSGSGKSTLLHILGGLSKPDSGSVLLNGGSLGALKEPELADVRNRTVGFVFQAHYLLPQLTVMENVLLPVLAHSRRVGPETIERANGLLREVALDNRMNHQANLLSGGERQRAALVRALINQPKVLLADEPTGSLDQASSAAIAELLRRLNASRGMSLIVVTHSPDLAGRMDREFRLTNGSLQSVR